jgi:hypothetical protein
MVNNQLERIWKEEVTGLERLKKTMKNFNQVRHCPD